MRCSKILEKTGRCLWMIVRIMFMVLLLLQPVALKDSVYRVRVIRSVRKELKFCSPVDGFINSPFGRRGRRMHTGIDIVASKGSVIRAAAGGVVKQSGYFGGYGYMVSVRHDNGYVTRYAHCSVLKVKKGMMVSEGEVIGLVGSTGRSTGSHLHFEVMRDGRFLNPEKYLLPNNS